MVYRGMPSILFPGWMGGAEAKQNIYGETANITRLENAQTVQGTRTKAKLCHLQIIFSKMGLL